VTTQHTHPEQNDADFIAEESSSTPESGTASQQQNAAPESATQANIPGDVEQPSTFSSTTPLKNGESVRPFSDFIEEFRQTEVRFQTALDAYASETQSNAFVETPQTSSNGEKHRPAAATESAPAITPTAVAAPESGENAENASNTGAGTETSTSNETPGARPVSPLLRPASHVRVPRRSNTRHRAQASAPAAAPVSEETQATPPQQVQQQSSPAPESEAASPAEVTPALPAEGQPRPARRYRFDRPAAKTASATAPVHPVQLHAENGPAAYPSTTGNGQIVERDTLPSQSNKPATAAAPAGEQSNSKPAAAQEAATPPEQDRKRKHGQDRQGQAFSGKEQSQAQEQPTATPALETPAASTAEALASSQVEINPEDLPPLEYSELQKASSRRRRRRSHPGTPTATPIASGSPVASSPTPTQSVKVQSPLAQPPLAVTPRSPVTPATPTPASAGQYSITSGFTVNQMNNGNGDGTSPFMGPEPSPARGTIAAQKARSIRNDVQRTPIYPVRSTEPNPASLQQIANVITQSFQIQTDRMLAEMRRANQTPTNISVSVPQFPSNERVGVFVDVANLLYSARTLRITIDFGKLLDFLRGNRRLVRAHAYCPTSPQPGDEQMFLQAVKGLGYRITTKNYKTFASGAKKADLDLDLCMDVVRLVDGKAVDDIVLVSGDSDFMPMLDYCSDHGVRVEVAAFDEAMSATLRQSCDVFINLGMLEEIRATV
jgi:uncharacterized LabA/DUF88 family protein